MTSRAPETGDGMKADARKRAAERYEQELRKGEFFWPDSIYKDAARFPGHLRAARASGDLRWN